MKLDRVVLENYRQYVGRQQLTFSREPQRGVTVVHGVNGAGKTSLFLAINWCLYGEGFANLADVFSKGAASRLRPGDQMVTRVEVTFTHEGERYIVRRQVTGVRQDDGSIVPTGQPEVEMVRVRGTGVPESIRNPTGTMNAILPGNVRTYFLFDGEKIDNFAKPEAAEEVRYAIYNVLKLEVLTRGQRHLQDAADEYRRELKQVSTGELLELVERLEQRRGDRSAAVDKQKSLESEIASARQKVRDIDLRLAEKQEAQLLQQRREILERDLTAAGDERERITATIRDLAAGAYLVLAEPVVAGAAAVLEGKRTRGEIPSSVRRQFVQDLLDQGVCVCGRPFEADGEEARALEALLHRSLPGSVQDDALETAAVLGGLPDRMTRHREQIARAMERRAELTDQIRGLEAELDEVSGQLKGSPQEEISGLERQRRDFQSDIDTMLLQQGAEARRISDLTQQIAEIEREVERARKEEKRHTELSNRMLLAQQSADAIGRMYQTFADDMRRRIESETRDTFSRLIWKDTQFQDVTLNPAYELQVIDRWGQPARPDLSAGERQVLSLSFITAMARVSEEEAPLVMDTPFGRLSSHHRESVTEHLPQLTHQLVLFVTDEELRDTARANLEGRIGAEFRLEFDQTDGSTTIVEVA